MKKMTLSSNTFVVFDLDDTLYKENDYHESGLTAVASLIEELYQKPCLPLLHQWKADGVEDLWSALCEKLELPDSVKVSLLWCYRLHSPQIRLSDGNKRMLLEVEARTAGIALLTDGRSATQRLKLKALGLLKYPVYISEEWQSSKPDAYRFQKIMQLHKAEHYIYVADNPTKDFKPANDLGWSTIGLRDDGKNVHDQSEAVPNDYLPDFWIDTLAQLTEAMD